MQPKQFMIATALALSLGLSAAAAPATSAGRTGMHAADRMTLNMAREVGASGEVSED